MRVEWQDIALGELAQDGFVESFNGRLQDECLYAHLVTNLRNARHLIAAWRQGYDHHRPQMSLEGMALRRVLNRSVKEQTLNRTNFRLQAVRVDGHVFSNWMRRHSSFLGLPRV